MVLVPGGSQGSWDSNVTSSMEKGSRDGEGNVHQAERDRWEIRMLRTSASLS